MTHALHVFRPQTFAYFGDNGVALLPILCGNTDFHQLVMFEREVDLPQHGFGQTLGTKTDNGPQCLALAAQLNQECFFQHGNKK